MILNTVLIVVLNLIEEDWTKKWNKPRRRRKIFILGGRSGTTLIHKCLLITGLKNWGNWSLDYYETEPPIKDIIWKTYPNVLDGYLKPTEYFEIAKCPDFGFIIPQLEKLYPKSKYIITGRKISEVAKSHMNIFGNYLLNLWRDNFPEWVEQLKKHSGKIPKNDMKQIEKYVRWRYDIQTKALSDIPNDRKIIVDFHWLMDSFDEQMKRIADFIDIPYDLYMPLWRELRKIKLMATSSDVKKYI